MNCEIISIVISLIAIVISLRATQIAKKSYLATLKALFYNNDSKQDPTNGRMTFNITNLGEYAQITKVYPISENINIVNNDNLPFSIYTNDDFGIVIKYKGDMRRISNNAIELCIHYTDKDNNKHRCKFTYKNSRGIFTEI